MDTEPTTPGGPRRLDDVQLVDTLMEEHYRGEWSLYARPGHIPGASNLPAVSLFGDLGRYLPEHGTRYTAADVIARILAAA